MTSTPRTGVPGEPLPDWPPGQSMGPQPTISSMGLSRSAQITGGSIIPIFNLPNNFYLGAAPGWSHIVYAMAAIALGNRAAGQ
jgi:hypothetical protein